ncbi:PAS domain S-box protein [Sediminibacterium sp. TEGAF015]|uniref:PAS domain S-box protein n=1 Tax=Sediminibacterium sp. TEGAF015 TaxID=575378 RepID=UPI0021FB2A88|nr:PAS domain S-box protein [Sediminibacterium sp. TEGAF015]BDQ12914.1 hypothetical protein TEGAF0_21310 [Sediminibacterium sp. TEGAF015]
MRSTLLPTDLDSAAEEQFTQLIEHLAVGVVKHRADLSIILANVKAFQLLGLTKDQLIGKTSFDPSWHVIDEHGQVLPGELHPAALALKTAKPVENVILGVFRPITKDRIWILATAIPELDERGVVQYITVTFSEIDQFKKKEVSLVEHNKLIRSILDASFDAIIVYNKQFDKIFLSQSVADISGYTLEELYATPAFYLVPESEKEQLYQVKNELITKGTIKNFSSRIVTKSGQVLDFNWSGKWDAEMGLFFLIGKNITEQNIYDSQLIQSKRLFKFSSEVNDLILNAKQPLDLYNGICDIAVNTGGFLFAFVGLRDDINETIQPYKFAGFESGYLEYFKKHISLKNTPEGNGPSGRTIRDGKIYYCNDIENDQAMTPWKEEALKRGYRSSLTMPIRVENRTIAQLAFYANKPNFFTEEEMALIHRINENINYAMSNFALFEKHQAARVQIDTLTLAIEQSTTSIMITDTNGVFEYVNPSFCKSSGYVFEELQGLKTSILRSGYTSESEYQNLWAKIKNKESWVGEFCNKRKDGSLYWVKAYISPVVNENGDITKFIGVEEDITAQKETLSHLEIKNKQLERIAWEQSHLVRAPLARILGLVNLFNNDLVSEAERVKFLKYLQVSAEELDAVIKAIVVKTNA